PEEQPTRGERRPAGTIEDTMIRLKVGRCAASHNPENRRDRPLSWSKDGAGHEDFHVLPNGSRKDRGKDPNSTAKGDRQGDHGHPFRMKRIWLSLPINCDSNWDNWIKSSSECRRSDRWQHLSRTIWRVVNRIRAATSRLPRREDRYR